MPGDGRDGPRTAPLVPLPAQPDGVPWPADDWPRGEAPVSARLGALVEEVFDPGRALGETLALVVVAGGRLVFERYGGELEHFDRPPDPVGPDTPLLSWSVAKSAFHSALGLVVADGRIDPGAPAAVAEWAGRGDPRGAITVEHLLTMRDGLDFCEDYVDERRSDVIAMLFGAGRDDVAGFAARRALAATPGERFSYSSGSTNILSGLLADVVGSGDAYRGFLQRRLFGPLAMTSAEASFDAAGTWVASSFLYATARDFARFGLFALRDGVWDGGRLLPPGWMDHGRRVRSVDPDDGAYGAHWWSDDDGFGTFGARGYDGQSITVCPSHDLVVVRLGRTPAERASALRRWRVQLVAALGDALRARS